MLRKVSNKQGWDSDPRAALGHTNPDSTGMTKNFIPTGKATIEPELDTLEKVADVLNELVRRIAVQLTESRLGPPANQQMQKITASRQLEKARTADRDAWRDF